MPYFFYLILIIYRITYIYLLFVVVFILMAYYFCRVILRKPFLFYVKLNNLFKKIDSGYIKIF